MTSAAKAKGVPRPGAAQAAVQPEAAPAPEERLKAQEGAVIAGKFRLERPLGRGAMGSVWVARHLDLDVLVAVKLMLLDTEPDASISGSGAASQQARTSARARFEREAKGAAQLRSANIVRTLDYGVFLNAPYMVMELLEGEDLAARLHREKNLPPSEVARILVPIARALQLAHDAGLVHRDLKPGNIFLAKEGDDEVPKILDFGIARSLKKEVNLAVETTIDGMLVGTPSYMSPEQATGGNDIDHRSDLWSLGVVAFLALTGRKPFPGPRALDAVVQICSGPIPKPSDYVQGLPVEVDRFVARALERDRERRFQQAKEMARALAPFLPRSYSSRPPPMHGGPPSIPDTAGAAEDPDAMATQPGSPLDPSYSGPEHSVPKAVSSATDTRPAKRSALLIAGISLSIAVGASVAWFATRKPSNPDQVAALQSSAAPTALPSGPPSAAIELQTPPSASSAAALASSSPPPAVSSAPAQTAVRTAAQPPKTAPTTTAVPPPASTKKGRDLGY